MERQGEKKTEHWEKAQWGRGADEQDPAAPAETGSKTLHPLVYHTGKNVCVYSV